MDESAQPVRLDKWLWAARFYKTRSIAKQMIEGGKVEYNGFRAKTSRIVEIGALITLRQGFETKTIVVKGLDDARKGHIDAIKLYEETAESISKRERNAELRRLGALASPCPDDRPDKKQRRELLRLKNEWRTEG